MSSTQSNFHMQLYNISPKAKETEYLNLAQKLLNVKNREEGKSKCAYFVSQKG